MLQGVNIKGVVTGQFERVSIGPRTFKGHESVVFHTASFLVNWFSKLALRGITNKTRDASDRRRAGELV